MDKQTKEALLKIAEEVKKTAKDYYIKKYAAAKNIEQYLIVKELERDAKNGVI